MRVLVLMCLVGFVSIARAEVPTLDEDQSCSVDADCVMSDFNGCCSSCPAQPRAWSKKVLKKHTDICAVVDCAGRSHERCEPEKGPKKAARCVQKQCVAR